MKTERHCQAFDCMTTNTWAEMVYIGGCDQMHLTELYYCEKHTLNCVHTHDHCWCGAEILEYETRFLADGTEPEDPRFYPGEWVGVKINPHNGKETVLAHNPNPQKVVKQLSGGAKHLIYQVERKK